MSGSRTDAGLESFEIREMSSQEFGLVIDWAAKEGWNPGLRDAECFFQVDPEGFLVGLVNNAPVAAISVVNYDDHYAFLGFYIVLPEHRGKGFGYRLWRTGLAHAGDRTIGLDGVVDQQSAYAAEGFVYAHKNIRFGGRVDLKDAGIPDGFKIVPAGELPPSAIGDYDRRCFPSSRPAFLRAWTEASGHVAKAVVGPLGIGGFGVIRPCREGAKIGPLFADSREIAEALLVDLSGSLPDGIIYLDTPCTNEAAIEMAEASGLEPVFETARMYKGPASPVDHAKIFGITTFELG